MSKRRVAVTGIGLVTAIGSTVEDFWSGIMTGESPVRRVTRFDASEFACGIAVEVDGFRPFEPEDRRLTRLDRFSQFAVRAAHSALLDARLEPHDLSHETAVYVGSALGGIAFAEEQHERYLASGIRSVAPGLALSVFAGAAATNICIAFGLHGPAISNANSCASGAVAIGEAFKLVQTGRVDIALAGGVETPLAPLTFGSFALIRAMSRRNNCPAEACRPFDLHRDGFVMGEGAALLVLEERERALERGARLYGEMIGYASTNDAHHMTAPLPDGREAARAMELALLDARLTPPDVGYINAHATGTSLGDAAEAAAIRSVFGEDTPPVSSTKPLHGHALGASAAIEAAVTILALHRAFLPNTRNLGAVDPTCALNHVPSGGRHGAVPVALSNSFGFGGINAALVLAGDG